MRKGLIWGLSAALTITSICGPVDMINAADISIESESVTEENIDFASEEITDAELPVAEETSELAGDEAVTTEIEEEEAEPDLGDSSETEIQDKTIFIDDYAIGYGESDTQVRETIAMTLKEYGIPIDATYTGKAFMGMGKYIDKEKIRNKKVLFIHTGGTPLFFDTLKNWSADI